MGKKRKPKAEYTISGCELRNYRARVEAGINYEVRDPHLYRDRAKVFKFHSSLELEAVYVYPDDRVGQPCTLTIHGKEGRYEDFNQTLSDCQVRDDKGGLKFRKIRGEFKPEYDVPHGIGLLERQRGTQAWSGWAWVSPQTVTDMLTRLPSVRPLYVGLHEVKIERTRWIITVSLQTTNPADE
ncbi:MAG: hypothetical protein U5R46_08445 [Gammaproteobacteria bacterium]|nr:hypothetical protein [Gammaproteobacteria bacterium]